MHTHTFSERTSQNGIWRQTASGQGGKDGAQVVPCAWDPKMFSSWVGIPKGSVLAPKHHQVAGPERPAEGWGGSSCAAHRLLAHIKHPFRVIGWQGSSDSPPQGLCTEYKSSSLLAPVTKKVIENEGSSAQLPVSRHHGGRPPRFTAGSSTKAGHQHPLPEAERVQSGVPQRNSLE